MSKTYKVFVYGTLKRGWGNNRLISQVDTSRFLGHAYTGDVYYFAKSGCPFVIEDEKLVANPSDDNLMGIVLGEVYEVDETTLGQLDQLEGHPNWYMRETVDVRKLGDRFDTKVWMYKLHKSRPMVCSPTTPDNYHVF